MYHNKIYSLLVAFIFLCSSTAPAGFFQCENDLLSDNNNVYLCPIPDSTVDKIQINSDSTTNYVDFTGAKNAAQCPNSDFTPDKILISSDPSAPYVDFNREVKDLTTDFVVKNFFKTPDTLFNFTKLVYETIDNEIAKYRTRMGLEVHAISFLFKGGNVLRLVANEIFALLPFRAKQILKEYTQYFKRSDADFSIFVNPNKLVHLNYEDVMRDMYELAYDGLNTIRDEFNKNPFKYFNYFQYNGDFADMRLRSYFNKLPNLESVKDPENKTWYHVDFSQLQFIDDSAVQKNLTCEYLGQFDYLFHFENNDKTSIIGERISKNPHWMANTINLTLEWPSGINPQEKIKFYLVRAKAYFEYTYLKDGKLLRKPIGGELIDISLPHRYDFRINEFFKNYDKVVADYTLVSESGEHLKFKAESIQGLTTDLHEVVFESFKRPWASGPKYMKRVNRLFFFYIIDLLSHYGLGSAKGLAYLQDVTEKILFVLKEVFPLTKNISQKAAEQLKINSQVISKRWPKMANANKFWQSLGSLVAKNIIGNPEESDEAQIELLINTIEHNLKIIEKLFLEKPTKKIDPAKVYNGNINNFF